MTILDGKKVSNDIKEEIAEHVKSMISKGEKEMEKSCVHAVSIA